MSVLTFYFGWPDGAVWSNLLASAICVALAWWRLRAKMVEHHAEALAQAARHHAEQLEQAGKHHAEQMALAERRHAQLTDHVSAVGSHVMTAAVDVPHKLLADIAKAPKATPKPKPGGAT